MSDDSLVVVGIDAGGSATRARAAAAGRTIFEGRGGPGNPLATAPGTLAASYRAALAGCPEPARVAACVAGTGSARPRAQVAGLLAERFPAATIRVLPDYAAALAAAPGGTDLVVVAGTGSVVCSPAADGGYNVSGGRGWILGDRGSAARLGQAMLEWFCDDDNDDQGAGDPAAGLVRDILGLTDWPQVVAALSASAHPAALLARAAPVLTGAAESGVEWAVARLDAEMAALAATTARHIERYLSPGSDVRVALAGGVWTSKAALVAYETALTVLTAAHVLITGPHDPLTGAVTLAAAMSG